MAIITTENDITYDDGTTVRHGIRKWVTHTRLVKTDIERAGLSGFTKTVRRRGGRHDPKTTLQLAYRSAMKLWDRLTYYESISWPTPHMKSFFTENVPKNS